MKLNKEQIEEIRELRKQGLKLKEIAERYGTTPPTILYYTDEAYRKRVIERIKKHFNSKTQKEKKRIYKQRLPYIKEYRRKRYREDETFRTKEKERALKNNERKRTKKD